MRKFYVIYLLLCTIYSKTQGTQDNIQFLKVTNCVACRFIWENIEEALGDSQRNSILAAEAFQYYCKISPDIFFQPCNDMFEKLFDLSEKFTQKQTISQICSEADMCDSNSNQNNSTNLRFKKTNSLQSQKLGEYYNQNHFAPQSQAYKQQ